jgi:hypothetical protein
MSKPKPQKPHSPCRHCDFRNKRLEVGDFVTCIRYNFLEDGVIVRATKSSIIVLSLEFFERNKQLLRGPKNKWPNIGDGVHSWQPEHYRVTDFSRVMLRLDDFHDDLILEWMDEKSK